MTPRPIDPPIDPPTRQPDGVAGLAPGQRVGRHAGPGAEAGRRCALRLARAYLLRVAEPPAPALARFVAEHGPLVAARLVRERHLPADVAAETEARCGVDRAEADLAAAEVAGGRLVIPEDDEWPCWPFAAFDQATARGVTGAVAPLALWVRGPGRLDELAERAVAIVGARAASAYGEHVACELGYGVAGRGWTVVSGAAYGIDGAAHRGALAAEGDTVAVLACGIDVHYPAGHGALLKHVAERGAVISEYAPGTPPARHRFLHRNRLIAALGHGTVVVEAGVRSGAVNTASTAVALGRVLMAVPGPVTSAQSIGCHELLRTQQAVLVTGVDDVVESAGQVGADLAAVRDRPVRRTDGLDRDELRVHEALRPRAGRPADWIARESGVPIARVRAALPILEQRGLAERCETGWRLSRSPSTRGGA